MIVEIDNELVILLPNTDALNNFEANGDSSTQKIEATKSNEVRPKEVAELIENLVSNSNKKVDVNPE